MSTSELDLWFCMSQEPDVQQKQTYHKVPQDQSASQLATPGASASEDATT